MHPDRTLIGIAGVTLLTLALLLLELEAGAAALGEVAPRAQHSDGGGDA